MGCTVTYLHSVQTLALLRASMDTASGLRLNGLEPAIGRITPTTGRLDAIFGMLA
jgi:hypothetical protein